MSYSFLQHYWCFVVALLGALLVFMMFVQGANSLLLTWPKTAEQRRIVLNSTGRKWELTFTTLVTFGGAFFAAFPLFYATCFGGAYWLWMIILFTFVVQAVSYEFQGKAGNLLGARTFHAMLALNGLVAPFLLGVIVSTFYHGAPFLVDQENMVGEFGSLAITRWLSNLHGLEALSNPWNVAFGVAVVALSRILGILYVMNSVNEEDLRRAGLPRLAVSTVVFLVPFLAYLWHILTCDGFAIDPIVGNIVMEPNKYLYNMMDQPIFIVAGLYAVIAFLYGIIKTLVDRDYNQGIWPTGIATVVIVLILLLTTAWNYTAYYPSTIHLQSSLTLYNSSSSEFTLRVMFWVSLLIPFVLAYIVYAWRKIDWEEIAPWELDEKDML